MALPESQSNTRMTEAAYLQYDADSELKNEFVDGEIIAMTGATFKHNSIVLHLGATLLAQLRGKPCQPVAPDMRVKVESTVSYRYPDVVVVCGEPDIIAPTSGSLVNPTVLVEVLSPSTASTDHIQKLREYSQIAILKDYLIVSQDAPRIEHYHREADGKLSYVELLGLDNSLYLELIDCTIAFADIYERVNFDDTADDA